LTRNGFVTALTTGTKKKKDFPETAKTSEEAEKGDGKKGLERTPASLPDSAPFIRATRAPRALLDPREKTAEKELKRGIQ